MVLLGQNVNSYHDKSPAALTYSAELPSGGEYQVAEGFSNLYRSRGGKGVYFVDLMDQVSPLFCSCLRCLSIDGSMDRSIG